MTLSAERSAENESLFRDANEQLEQRRLEILGSADRDERTPFLCECDDPNCTSLLRLNLDQYERARESARTFLVRPGHVAENARVASRTDDFWLVEKLGLAGEVAEREDPRRGQ